MVAARSGGPFHLRLVPDELARKPVAGILHVDPIVHTKPVNLERHLGWYRGRGAAEQRVAEVVEVEDLNVVGFHDRVAGAGIDAADAVVGQARRPEETARRDTRIEVGELCTPRTGGVDVNSYECERALPGFAVDTAVDALHESHVRPVEGQFDPLAG